MKRLLTITISYFITGIGCYYTFSGGASFYSILMLAVGFSGILFDVFHKKLKTE